MYIYMSICIYVYMSTYLTLTLQKKTAGHGGRTPCPQQPTFGPFPPVGRAFVEGV